MANENINLMFEIETSSVIEAVENDWTTFQHVDLIKLSSSLNTVLLRERKGEVLISQSEQPQYFENTIKRRNDELSDIMNKRRCPIPSWFLENSDAPGVISILPIDVSIKLPITDDYFNQFCAFRLATLESKLVPEFMKYQFINSFKSDTVEFRRAMQFILAGFETVIGARRSVIVETLNLEYFIVKSKSEYVETTTVVDSNSPIEVLKSIKNDNLEVIVSIKHKTFIEIENVLFDRKFINASYEWQKEKVKLVTFIHVLHKNKYFRNTYLREDKTLSPSIRRFFEKRYNQQIDDAFKPSNFDEVQFRKHFIDFTFVEAV